MREEQLLQGGYTEKQLTDTQIRIRTASGTICPITPVSPSACLFPAAILSLLAISGTSWFLPGADQDVFIPCCIVAGTMVITIAAVSVAVIGRHHASE